MAKKVGREIHARDNGSSLVKHPGEESIAASQIQDLLSRNVSKEREKRDEIGVARPVPLRSFEVEIAFATADRQSLRSVSVTSGDTVGAAIAKSGLCEEFAEYDIRGMAVGIWGHEVDRTRAVRKGDRIEVYRPLQLDPRDARRQLALRGLTMTGESELP